MAYQRLGANVCWSTDESIEHSTVAAAGPADPRKWIAFGGFASRDLYSSQYDEAYPWAEQAVMSLRIRLAAGPLAGALARMVIGRIGEARQLMLFFCSTRQRPFQSFELLE